MTRKKVMDGFLVFFLVLGLQAQYVGHMYEPIGHAGRCKPGTESCIVDRVAFGPVLNEEFLFFSEGFVGGDLGGCGAGGSVQVLACSVESWGGACPALGVSSRDWDGGGVDLLLSEVGELVVGFGSWHSCRF